MKRKLHVLVVLLVMSAVLFGCATPATPTATQVPPTNTAEPTKVEATKVEPTKTPVPTNTTAPTVAPVTRPIVIIASDQPGPLDPAENWTFGGASYLPLVYEGLFRIAGSTSLKIVPWLAADVPTNDNGGISDDGLVYTIKINPKAKFADGSPVNADAVIYSYQRIETLSKGANGITADWIAKMDKVDDQTVKFTLKQPFGDFLNSMSSVWGNYIVNPTIAKANEKDNDWGYAWMSDHAAGSGPYLLTSYDRNANTITLDRNKDYWGGWDNNKAPIEKAIIRWISEPATARSMLEKGDADVWVNPQATDFAALSTTAGMKAVKSPSIMQYYLSMNGSVKPLDDVRVRQALQYSFNTSEVIKKIFNDTLTPMNAAVGPGYPDVYAAKTQYSYDLDKAKALLKEAGLENGFTLTVNQMGFFPNDQAVLEYWQADLAKIGVTLKIQQVAADVFSKAWFNDCSAGTAPNIGEISALGVGGDYPSAWEVMAQVYPVPRLGGAKCSVVYLNNSKINDLMNEITKSTDPEERQTLFQSVYDAISDDAGAIWIGQALDLVVMRDVMQGYEYSFATGGNYLPLASMSLTK